METQNPVTLSAFSLYMFTKLNYKLVMYVLTLLKHKKQSIHYSSN